MKNPTATWGESNALFFPARTVSRAHPRESGTTTRILVALDTSTQTRPVFDAAADTARCCGAVLYPVRAILAPPGLTALLAWTRGRRDLEHIAREELARLTIGAPDLSIAKPVVRRGQPWRVILEAARELDVELIVLGSRAYQGLDTVPGTTTAHVTRNATCNVLVVYRHSDHTRVRAVPSDST